MLGRLMRGPLLVLLWQAAPLQVSPDSSGRYRLTLGYTTGHWEERTYSCEGSLTSVEPRPFAFAAAQLDAWPANNFRISALGGGLAYGDETAFGSWPVLGGVVALETHYVGVGFGAMTTRWVDPEQWMGPESGDMGAFPSAYLRIGSLDAAHVRLDMLAPTVTMPGTGIARLGIGFNQGLRRGVSGYVGMGIDPYGGTGPFADMSIPVIRALDLSAAGRVALFDAYGAHGGWSLTVAARYGIGR